MTDNALIPLIVALLSGGLVSAIGTFLIARRKLPAETDSIIVTGAESAVTTLQATLAAETRRADRNQQRCTDLEGQIARKDERIERLEARLDELQRALDDARDELHRIINQERR